MDGGNGDDILYNVQQMQWSLRLIPVTESNTQVHKMSYAGGICYVSAVSSLFFIQGLIQNFQTLGGGGDNPTSIASSATSLRRIITACLSKYKLLMIKLDESFAQNENPAIVLIISFKVKLCDLHSELSECGERYHSPFRIMRI